MNSETSNFLIKHGWPVDTYKPFPPDWSARMYARLSRAEPPHCAILMQTTPDIHFKRFIQVAELLRSVNASAPQIYAYDAEHGLMLLEDFGERNFGRLIDSGNQALPLFLRATDALIQVQRALLNRPLGDLPVYNSDLFISLLDPLIENFSYKNKAIAESSLRDIWKELLQPLASQPQSLLLRDFIVDNVMDLSSREGWRNAGILDFELAGAGPLAYDVASLTERVRRDLPDTLVHAVIERYLASWPELDRNEFLRSLHIFSTHRHMRLFARLQKLSKPDFLARTHTHLKHCLTLPEIRPVALWCKQYLPDYF